MFCCSSLMIPLWRGLGLATTMEQPLFPQPRSHCPPVMAQGQRPKKRSAYRYRGYNVDLKMRESTRVGSWLASGFSLLGGCASVRVLGRGGIPLT